MVDVDRQQFSDKDYDSAVYSARSSSNSFSGAKKFSFSSPFDTATYLRAQFSSSDNKSNDLIPTPRLTFDFGDVIAVTESNNSVYWKGIISSEREGYFPSPQTPSTCYQSVAKRKLPYIQPVVIVGSLKSLVQDYLYQECPTQFASCVPHTTRNPRENELGGSDYHFVRRETMQALVESNAFVEIGQFNNNLYGTTEAAVRMVAQRERKHCILDALQAVPRLNEVKLYPIVLLVGAGNWRQLMDIHHGTMSDFEARETIEKDLQIERENLSSFNAIIKAKTVDEASIDSLRLIDRLDANPFAWVPTN